MNQSVMLHTGLFQKSFYKKEGYPDVLDGSLDVFAGIRCLFLIYHAVSCGNVDDNEQIRN